MLSARVILMRRTAAPAGSVHMSEAGTTSKVCVICSQDCAGKPRVKDAHGRYFCKACHEAAMKKAGSAPAAAQPPQAQAASKPAVKAASRPVAPPIPEPEPEPAFDGFDNAAILEGLEASAATAAPAGEQCPSCGMPLPGGAMVCLSCGFNRATGRAGKVKVSKEGADAAAIAGTAAKVLWQANPLAWAAMGALGGAIGAGVWYFVAMQTGREIRFLPLGIGILVGLCIKFTAGSYAGATSGGIAVALTLVSIISGKYLVFKAVVEEVEKEIGFTTTLTEDALIGHLARDVALRKESTGQNLVWPEDVDREFALEPDEFPRGVWDEAAKQWRSAKPEWRAQYKSDKEADFQAEWNDAKAGGFLLSFANKGALFILAALGAALWVGSGGDVAGAIPRKDD